MTNTEKVGKVLSKLKNGFSYEDFKNVMLETFLSVGFDRSWETEQDIFNRGQVFKKFMREYITKNPLPAGEKLGIVCHSKFICALTSTHCTVSDDDKSKMVNYTWLNNCQTVAWNNF